jgi:hypothetical protein
MNMPINTPNSLTTGTIYEVDTDYLFMNSKVIKNRQPGKSSNFGMIYLMTVPKGCHFLLLNFEPELSYSGDIDYFMCEVLYKTEILTVKIHNSLSDIKKVSQ